MVPDDALSEAVRQLAATIATNPAVVIRAGKALLHRQMEANLAKAYAMATETIARNLASDEAREGIDAFLEKRPPGWLPLHPVSPRRFAI